MKQVIHTHQMALVSLMTALLCITAPFSLQVPFSPVPLSLATFSIYFCVMVLGMKLGGLSVCLYILLGLAGLPIFSNFTGGAGKLLGPTGGYIFGYLFLAIVCGIFVDKAFRKPGIVFAGMVLGTAICYLLGTCWLSFQTSMTLSQAFLSAVAPFLPGDVTKLATAMILGYRVRKRLTKANLLSSSGMRLH